MNSIQRATPASFYITQIDFSGHPQCAVSRNGKIYLDPMVIHKISSEKLIFHLIIIINLTRT